MNAPANNNQVKAQNEVPKFMFHVEPDGSVQPAAVVKSNVVEELPPNVYSMAFDQDRGFYFAPVADFKMPERVYGDVTKHVDHFLRSYELNDKNLGAVLIGDAGSGKTLTLKALVMKAQTLGMPIILINDNFPGSAIVGILDRIAQPCVVCFDEFDKVFSQTNDNGMVTPSSNQRSILQLLDGTSTGSKKLYIFTANSDGMINEYMKDRPSRIRYTIRFKRMEVNTVVDYVTTNLRNCTDEHVQAFVHLTLSKASGSKGLNFDMMRELVREMNQFGGTVTDAIEMMMSSGKKSSAHYHITVFKDDEQKNRIKQEIAYALGTHQGPYVTKDKMSITVETYEQRQMTDDDMDDRQLGGSNRNFYASENERSFIMVEKRIELTEQDFVSFGADHEYLEFAKDGLVFVCRYTDVEEFNNNHYIVAEQNRERSRQLNRTNRLHAKKMQEQHEAEAKANGGHPGDTLPGYGAATTVYPAIIQQPMGVLSAMSEGQPMQVQGGVVGRGGQLPRSLRQMNKGPAQGYSAGDSLPHQPYSSEPNRY